jgi:hypothetical protein
MFINTHRASGQVFGRKARLFKVIGTDSIETSPLLFKWLFEHTDASDPQVTISGSCRQRIDDFKREMIECSHVAARPLYLHMAVSDLLPFDWPYYKAQCGWSLLRALAHVSSAMERYESNKIPTDELCRTANFLMISSGKGLHEQIRYSDDRLWLKSTPEFEEKFGLRVKVPLPPSPELDQTGALDDLIDLDEE